jgi:hypothetical protein
MGPSFHTLTEHLHHMFDSIVEYNVFVEHPHVELINCGVGCVNHNHESRTFASLSSTLLVHLPWPRHHAHLMFILFILLSKSRNNPTGEQECSKAQY